MTNKTIALIAHDARKFDMVEWVRHNAETLLKNKLVCTGTTGKLIEDTLEVFITEYVPNKVFFKGAPKVRITKMKSGPLGGDAQIAAMVVEGKIDLCVFLIDDLTANPREAASMLLRQCRIHNIPIACNRHSADLMITSDLWGTEYLPTVPTYQPFKR